MFRLIFTLDYEIHGNGDGCPQELMVAPTRRMLDLFDEYGAKLTIMADVAEILKFREFKEHYGRDDYRYEAIAAQLREAIRRGHDVQLHLHPSYFNACHQNGRWLQDWTEYDFADLSLERLNEIVRRGRSFLEDLLKPVNPRYECLAFRAANWAVNPSGQVVAALLNNGVRIDTSVFKYGRREGRVSFDYSSAWSNLIPWPVKADDICQPDSNGKLLEFPIYAENRWLGAFLTPQRCYRACLSRLHRLSEPPESAASRHDPTGAPRSDVSLKTHWRVLKHAWKADFNQCSGGQLKRALERAEAEHGSGSVPLPFVLIGHSKLFTRLNEWSLRSLLRFVLKHPGRFGFATFADFDLADLVRSGSRRPTAPATTAKTQPSAP